MASDSTIDVTYKWDALGRRVYRDDGTSAHIFVQVGQQTIADYGAGLAASTPMYRYVYASYIDEPVLRYEPSATESLFYHRNQQYSVIALTDETGAIEERYAYSAYGEPVFLSPSNSPLATSNFSNRYTYTGREWDEDLSLYHFRARMYDVGSGRFCARDSLGLIASDFGLYQYVRSNPTLKLDPSGNLTLGDCLRWTNGCYRYWNGVVSDCLANATTPEQVEHCQVIAAASVIYCSLHFLNCFTRIDSCILLPTPPRPPQPPLPPQDPPAKDPKLPSGVKLKPKDCAEYCDKNYPVKPGIGGGIMNKSCKFACKWISDGKSCPDLMDKCVGMKLKQQKEMCMIAYNMFCFEN